MLIKKPTDKVEPITLALQHASLDDEEPFNALSYSWGEENPTYRILICDGVTQGRFRVRRNLYEFLQAARTSTHDWSHERIWIDQICINQDDHTERCQQVSQMGDLYSTAQATIVWPGSLHAHHNLAAKTPEYGFAGPIFSNQEAQAMIFPSDTPHPNIHTPSEPAVCLLTSFSRHALVGLLSSPYWWRLWIVQEIVLASRVRVLLSDTVWEFKDLHSVFKIFYNHKDHSEIVKCKGLDAKLNDILRRTTSLTLMRGYYSLSRRNIFPALHHTWSTIIAYVRATHCTISLDRIYGVMALLAEDLRVQPDYTISTRDLLRRILAKEITFTARERPRGDFWRRLKILLSCWGEFAGFEPVWRTGALTQLNLRPEPGETHNFFEHDVRLTLQGLDIQIPGEIEAALSALASESEASHTT